MTVDWVEPGGALAQFNAAQPQLSVRPGDRFVAGQGRPAAAGARQMVDALFHAPGDWTIEVERPAG